MPDAAAIANADTLVKEIFKNELESAKTPKAKADLGEKILARANETQ